MWWLLPAGIAAVGALGTWMFGPTIRALLGHDFEPAPKDDASVEAAIQNRMVDGGGL